MNWRRSGLRAGIFWRFVIGRFIRRLSRRASDQHFPGNDPRIQGAKRIDTPVKRLVSDAFGLEPLPPGKAFDEPRANLLGGQLLKKDFVIAYGEMTISWSAFDH